MSGSADAFIAGMYRNTIAWLESNPHDFDSLANGPLGEALTADELRDLAANDESMERFIDGCRESIARHTPKPPCDYCGPFRCDCAPVKS